MKFFKNFKRLKFKYKKTRLCFFVVVDGNSYKKSICAFRIRVDNLLFDGNSKKREIKNTNGALKIEKN